MKLRKPLANSHSIARSSIVIPGTSTIGTCILPDRHIELTAPLSGSIKSSMEPSFHGQIYEKEH